MSGSLILVLSFAHGYFLEGTFGPPLGEEAGRVATGVRCRPDRNGLDLRA
jgi:hypothetical protein